LKEAWYIIYCDTIF